MKALTEYIEDLPNELYQAKVQFIQILKSSEDQKFCLSQMNSFQASFNIPKSKMSIPFTLPNIDLLKNKETSIFYMQIFMILSKSVYFTELSRIVKENNVFDIILKEIHTKVNEKDHKPSSRPVFGSLDNIAQFKCYLEFLEFLNLFTCNELEFSAEKNLISLIYCESTDENLQFVFFKSFVGGLRFMRLCNNYYRSIKVCEEVISEQAQKLNQSFLKLFKYLLLKVNKNSSILTLNKRFYCVVSSEIIGLESLVSLFYSSQKSLYKKSKNLIFSLLTCFSSQGISKIETILDHLVSILIKQCDQSQKSQKKKLINLMNSLINRFEIKSKHKDCIKILAIFEECSKIIDLYSPMQVSQIRNKLAKAFGLKNESIIFEINDKQYGPQELLKKVKLTTDHILSLKLNEKSVEADVNFLRLALVEKRGFFWTLFEETAEETYNASCFSVAKNITKWSLNASTIEKKNFIQNLVSIKLSVQTEFVYSMSCLSSSHSWLKEIESMGYLNCIFEFLVNFIEKNPNFTMFKKVAKLVNNITDIKHFDSELNYKVCKSSFLWILKNPKNLPVSENDNILMRVISKIINKLKPVHYQLLVNLIRENADKFANYLIEVLDIARFLFPLKKIGDEDPHLQTLILLKYEGLYSGKDLNHLMLIVTLLSTLNYKPYIMLNKIFEILANYPTKENETFYGDILNNITSDFPSFKMSLFGFQCFLNAFLIPNPFNQNKNFPLLKSKNLREFGFNLVLNQCKLDGGKISILADTLDLLLSNKSWRKSKLKFWKIKTNSLTSSFECKGLDNPGTICYSNSFIQQLFHIPSFTNPVLSLNLNEKSCLSALQKVLFKLKFSCESSVSSNSLVKSCVGPKGLHEQMDTDEFISMLFEKCSKSELGIKFDEIIQKNFLGIQNLEIKCKRCQNVFNKIQDFKSIGLQIIKNEKNSLLNSLRKMTCGEMMIGKDALFCSTCKRREDSEMKLSFIELPLYLIFMVKRFEYDLSLMAKLKVNEVFEFTEDVNMMEFFKYKNSDCSRENFEYQLKGVINHVGTANLGHYTSCIRTLKNEWVQFNDSVVSKTSIIEVLTNSAGKSQFGLFTPSAYIIIYKKLEKFSNAELSESNLEVSQGHFFHQIIEKNRELNLRGILFAEGFLNSLIEFVTFQDLQIFFVKYCLSCFFRMDIPAEEKMRIYKEFYKNISFNTVVHLIEILSSLPGIQEFIICNPHPEHKTFLIVLIEQTIHSIEKSFIRLTFQRLMKIFADFSTYIYKFDIYFSKLFFLIVNNLEEDWKINYIDNTHLELLTNFAIKQKDEVEAYKSEFFWTEDYKMAEELNSRHRHRQMCTCMFFQFIVENFEKLSKKLLEQVNQTDFILSAIMSLKSKLGIIALSQLYSRIYKDNIDGALHYLVTIIETFNKILDENLLKLIPVFFKYFPDRNNLFFQFIEFYSNFFFCSHVKEFSMLIRCIIKCLRKLKYKEVAFFLSVQTREKFKNAIEIYLFQGGCSGVMRKISQDFFNGVENKDFDEDDEIEANYFVKNKIVWLSQYGTLMSYVVDDNFCNRILCFSAMGSGFLILDDVHFDRIKYIE